MRCPRRVLQFAREFENRARLFVASHTQFKDKPDMIEVDTTYSWQMPHGVDVRGLCALVPASSTNNIHAYMVVSSPVSAFFVPEHTPFCFPRLS